MSFLGIDVILCSYFTALPPAKGDQVDSMFRKVFFFVCHLFKVVVQGIYCQASTHCNKKNSSSFFDPLMDEKNLIIETKVVKSLFVLQILDSIQALLHKHC